MLLAGEFHVFLYTQHVTSNDVVLWSRSRHSIFAEPQDRGPCLGRAHLIHQLGFAFTSFLFPPA